MATLISHKTESDSLSSENYKPKYKSVIVRYQYEPINIYDIQSEPREINKFTLMMSVCFKKLCCCCRTLPEDEHDSPIGDQNSSLVGPIRKSYTLSNQARTTQQSAPMIIINRPLDDGSSSSTLTKQDNDSINSSVTKVVDNESIKSTTVLLTNELKESSRNVSEKIVHSCDQTKEIEASSRGSTLRSDEVYLSDNATLSSGTATLPRRSSSPLPHDTDRFPINRSGLQARSESMASVYSGAGEGARGGVTVRGEVQFSLLYNYRLGALEVGVRRARDLAPVDTKRNRSDPYVKVYLLPDKSKTGKRKTKVKKNTLSPVFEETLSFVQPLAALSARTLWLSVWHADIFGRNDFLGEVTLPLADVVFDDPAPTWYKLHERTEQFEEQQGSRGDLIIGLKFECEGRGKGTLHVLVKEAKNLVATKPNGLADVFCKSYLLPERGRLAKQKTGVSRRTLSPRWEHTFTYRGLAPAELAGRALELSLWDRDRLASNDFMGAVRLSLGTDKAESGCCDISGGKEDGTIEGGLEIAPSPRTL
ncbi:Synaptotagmin-like protein 4 [Papilio machaon]|uniref:Synaptotagmin-like protein 4 n=1 Tax=Papilio machaon TaxID=76193 RepID=A0A194RM78_PAPMA|nr:Synaptotagmin-like protein 4 [Papilio machaon]